MAKNRRLVDRAISYVKLLIETGDLFPNEKLVGNKATYVYDCRDFQKPRHFKPVTAKSPIIDIVFIGLIAASLALMAFI